MDLANVDSGLSYRTFTPDLEVRASGDGRTIFGILVPFGVPKRVEYGLVEQFRYGAFDHQLADPARVRLTRDHIAHGGKLIGRAVMFRNDAKGLYGELRVSKTPAGDETLELVKDGALRELSIGFRERQNKRLRDGTVERVTADLREVAVVLEGAYGELAVAMGVRHRVATPNLDQARRLLDALPELDTTNV